MRERELTAKDRAAIWEAREKGRIALEEFEKAKWRHYRKPSKRNLDIAKRLNQEADEAAMRVYALESKLRLPFFVPVSTKDESGMNIQLRVMHQLTSAQRKNPERRT